jgi:hypothetical protein
MSTFAKISFIASYDKVTYYSVALVDEEVDLPSYFGKFVSRHQQRNREKLNHILSWLKEIGNAWGARPHLFRDERKAHALPPKGALREPTYVEIEIGKVVANNLRLYCYRLSESVVFLFDGDVKTADAAQDCPNVGPHFRTANKLVQVIDECFNQGDIEWNDDRTDILYDEEFLLVF